MKSHNQPSQKSAFEAISEAQKIAFSPFIFQAVNALIKLGILEAVEAAGQSGSTVEELAAKLDVSEYGVQVLLDMALSARVVWQKHDDQRFVLDKIGYFFLNDPMTRINFNFTADVNYLGLAELTNSIVKGRPEGLKCFTEEFDTIYPILLKLPEPAKTSWRDFDHYYSDHSYGSILNKVFASNPQTILDIGGNSGKFALKCLNHNENVHLVIMDLPAQLEVAKKNIADAGFLDRVTFHPCNVLDENQTFYQAADVVWMSQFLDCFSLAEILDILLKTRQSMSQNGSLFIMELFWDRQEHEAAMLSLNATSLYFTALANGRSRMYSHDSFVEVVEKSGFKITSQTDHLGIGGHSLLHCQQR
jgi:ubiquinone/menaquinone biosynthesis C-methylase UbiE